MSKPGHETKKKAQSPDMHKAQIKHKRSENTEAKTFEFSRVCAFGLYLCFGSCALCFKLKKLNV